MKPTYDAAVPASLETVWASLTDVDSVLAALPGAALARDGDGVSGSLKCKLGTSQITYRITVRAAVGEVEFHTAVIAVTGREARGSGTLAASLRVALRGQGASTTIEVSGDIDATGRGEAADDAAWSKVVEILVNALLPQPAAEPVTSTPTARPPLAVAPPPVASPATGPARPQWMIFGVLGIVVLVLLRRRRHRRR